MEQLRNQLCELVDEALKLGSGETSFLIGLHVEHEFMSDEKECWYHGKVISTVPGFPSWFNIKYKDDSSIYTYQLMQDGDLKVSSNQTNIDRCYCIPPFVVFEITHVVFISIFFSCAL